MGLSSQPRPPPPHTHPRAAETRVARGPRHKQWKDSWGTSTLGLGALGTTLGSLPG